MGNPGHGTNAIHVALDVGQDHVIVECPDPVEGDAGVRGDTRRNRGEKIDRTSIGGDLEDIAAVSNINISELVAPGA